VLLTVSQQAGAGTRVYNEVLTGVIKSINTIFTTVQKFTGGSEAVYFNGVRQREGASNDYVRTESGGVGTGFDTITFSVAPRSRPGAKPDDTVTIDYDPV
jgi:hypothetical protein